ncbi:indole-3-pyruvate monooxygenase YUCCA8-like [Typha latifolia]|uniref:indole-3-pyruvate monooxygenase YUCCA8-like n=1 Tax=Typha latifolia TaxID=4733 RepID=UPI003C2FF69F
MGGITPPPTPPPSMASVNLSNTSSSLIRKLSIVDGPIIVGAGPSGLAVAASLRRLSVPFVILEKSDGIADLWSNRTYDRLCLHLPKDFCQLPHFSFPENFPTYASKASFLQYLHSYANHFSITPHFDHTVVDARFDPTISLWRVKSIMEKEVVEYMSPWLVVATGENAEAVVPKFKGKEKFKGSVLHSSEYKNGAGYRGKNVLVVGCGNSGMEMCLDLFEHGAMPFVSVRSGVHVLPKEMLGTSTFGVAMKLLKWLPLKLVDRFLLLAAKVMLGDTEKYGLKRPKLGPLELKSITGKSPVLDVGALSLIKSGRIKIVPEVESLTTNGARFVDGSEMEFDSVVFATGYRSNVPFWLKGSDFFTEDGKPRTPFPNGWKGENGLYCVGFTERGLLGASVDAVKAALDISERWKDLTENNK